MSKKFKEKLNEAGLPKDMDDITAMVELFPRVYPNMLVHCAAINTEEDQGFTAVGLRLPEGFDPDEAEDLFIVMLIATVDNYCHSAGKPVSAMLEAAYNVACAAEEDGLFKQNEHSIILERKELRRR